MKKCITPPYLQPGDKVALVAPARSVADAGLEQAENLLTQAGLKVIRSKHLLATFNQFAGTDEQRAEDFMHALQDDSIKAIFCARGGYGCLRIADLIDFSVLKKNPKWIVGYSDITVFHNIANMLGVCSLHATMPVNFARDTQSTQAMLDVLMGKPVEITWTAPEETSVDVSGILCGGNLSLLYALQGSNSLFSPEGGLIFMEDLDEYLYHVDRMIVSLKRSGYFNRAEAILCGGFDDMKDNAVPFGLTAEEIIFSQLAGQKTLSGFPAGHGIKNMPLVMGHTYTLQLRNKKGALAPL